MAAGSDDARGATKFRSLPYTDKTPPAAATGDAGDPDVCSSGPSTKSVWYRFQPRVSGKVTMNTFGSRYDTVLAVFKSRPGQSARHLELVVCDDVFSPFFSLQVPGEVPRQAKRHLPRHDRSMGGYGRSEAGLPRVLILIDRSCPRLSGAAPCSVPDRGRSGPDHRSGARAPPWVRERPGEAHPRDPRRGGQVQGSPDPP
jgi:hypothetical protein